MTIYDIRNLFTNSIAEIVLDQRNFCSAIKNEVEKINEQENVSKEIKTGPEYVSGHNMFFNCFETNKPIFYDQRLLTIDDVKQNIRHRKNRQYQWLIAEAYEKFEEFIENIYAYLGMPELNFWSLQDYGNITFQELKQCDFEWYRKQAKVRKGGASGIFKKIYKKFGISLCYHDVPLNILISFIEMMRHIIVHRRGTVASKENFFKDVFSSAGISTNDRRSEHIRKLFNMYFLDKKLKNTVFILELQDNIGPLQTFINIFDLLIEILLNAAYRICAECESYAMGKGFDPKVNQAS